MTAPNDPHRERSAFAQMIADAGLPGAEEHPDEGEPVIEVTGLESDDEEETNEHFEPNKSRWSRLRATLGNLVSFGKPQEEDNDDLVDLMTVGDAMEVDAVGDGEKMDVTVDSGAGESVANPRSMPQYPMKPSPGSLRGQRYRGPGGEVIPNQGQQKIAVKLESGVQRAMTFQSAPVRKPLLAVSGACDRDQFVIFDNGGSFICRKDNPEAIEILKLLKKMKALEKITLTRKNGTYTMPVFLQPFPARQGD